VSHLAKNQHKDILNINVLTAAEDSKAEEVVKNTEPIFPSRANANGPFGGW
jgi:hypothetical protein